MDVGRVDTTLGYRVDESGAREYDVRTRRIRKSAERKIDTRAGVDVDERGFRDYSRRARSIDRDSRDIVRSQGRVRTAFGAVYGRGGAMFAAAGGIYVFQAAGKVMVGAASDIEESLSKNRVLFGRYARDVDAFSQTSASSFGISRKAALEYTGVFGNLFRALGISRKEAAGMSTGLLTMAADMASFNNASIEDTLEAIRAGLVGETEPLRRFGVNMSDATLKTEAQRLATKGLIDESKAHASVLDPQTKALAAQSLIAKQTAAAHGDFKRTQGGLANQTKILKAELSDLAAAGGKRVLPFVRDGVAWFGKFFRGLREGTGAGGRVREFFGDAGRAIGRFVAQVRSGTGTGGRLRTVVESVAQTVGSLARSIFPLVRRLADAALKVAAFGGKVAASKAGLVAIHGAIGGLLGRLVGLGAAWAVGKVAAFAGRIRAAGGAIQFLNGVLRRNPLVAFATVVGAVAGALLHLTNRNRRTNVSADQLNDTLREQRELMRQVRDLDLDAAEAKNRVRSAALSVRRAEIELARARKTSGNRSLEAKEAEVALKEARLEQRRAQRGVADQEGHANDVRQDATKKTRESLRAARDRVEGLKREVGQLRIQTTAIGRSADKNDQLKKKEYDLATAQRELNSLVKQFPTSTRGISGLVSSFGRLRGVVDGTVGFVGSLDRAINNLNSKTVTVRTYHYDIFKTYQRARGGKVTSPGMVIHGEEAPTYPEYWISTNPRDKSRMMPLIAEAAGAVMGRAARRFQTGGAIGGTGYVPSLEPLARGVKKFTDAVDKFVARRQRDSFDDNAREHPRGPGSRQAEDGSFVPPDYYSSRRGDSVAANARQNPARGPGWRQAEDGSFVPPDYYDRTRGAVRNLSRELRGAGESQRSFGRDSRRASRDVGDLGSGAGRTGKRVRDLAGVGHSARTALRRLAEGGESAAKELKHLRDNAKDDRIRNLAGRVLTLRDRLSGLDKGSAEYRETARRLRKAQDELNGELGGADDAGKKGKRGLDAIRDGARDLMKSLGGGLADAIDAVAGGVGNIDAIDSSLKDSVGDASDQIRYAIADVRDLDSEIDRLRGKTLAINVYHNDIYRKFKRARGGKVTEPGIVFHGEEAPQHPEFWISTNPRDRSRMIPLLQEAAAALGARVAAFAQGGALRKSAQTFPAVGDIAQGYPTAGEGKVANALRRFDRTQRALSRMSRRHDMSNEEFVVEHPTTGVQTVDKAAVGRRVKELDEQIGFYRKNLISVKHGPITLSGIETIGHRPPFSKPGSAHAVIDMIDAYDAVVNGRQRVVKSWEERARKSGHPEIREAFHEKAREMQEWRDSTAETREDIWDQIKDFELDIEYLQQERKAALDAKPPPVRPGDPGGGETPADITARVLAELASFQSARSDLFGTYGSNFTVPGAAASPLAAAAGPANFGAASAPAGYAGAGAAKGLTVNTGGAPLIENNYDRGPPDAHLWAKDQAWQIPNALG